MPKNIEIKARAENWEGQLSRARAFCDKTESLVQEDVFFNCAKGRLKLRILGDMEKSHLIYYERDNQLNPKGSHYETAAVPNPGAVRNVLARAFGEVRIVRKKRTVLFIGQSRVHFDDVEGLGKFLEIEVCLQPGQSDREGEAVARELMDRLGIKESALIPGAYADMLKP